MDRSTSPSGSAAAGSDGGGGEKKKATHAPSPAADREDRDEGFDEVTDKKASFGFWKGKDEEAMSPPREPQKASPGRGKGRGKGKKGGGRGGK